jgi:rare lipoprotein A
MNQKLLSGLTATLLLSTLGTPLAGYANSSEVSKAVDLGSEKSLKVAANQPSTPILDLTSEVVKLGEQSPQPALEVNEAAIAKVHAHELSGRKAATLYVRNIPVLTVLDSEQSVSAGVKLGTQASSEVKLGTQAKSVETSTNPETPSETTPPSPQTSPNSASASGDEVLSQRDPVWRASEIAAKLNQLNRDGVDARTITVSWESRPGDSGYVIKAGDQVLALMDSNTILPDTTRNPETDALQATNRLRRLLGNAEPLSEVTGKPRRQTQVSVGPFHIALSGMASWYGPGFHGNQSASGEIFNEHKMTAAHRSLPFGTQVRVTNLDNGLSVIVRINDRGPFHGNRIIDLSTAAARVLGLIQTGVAPVRLDVITPHSVAEN